MGYFRFSLMLAVVYYHIVHPTVAGYLAVHGFFALSGYVITKVCAEVYGRTLRGKLFFLLNRIARVYPVYLASLAISLFCLWMVSNTAWAFHEYYRLPEDAWGWLVQFTLIGQSGFTPVRAPERLLPAAWSLSTEMVYYLLIGLVTGASKRATGIAFAASLLLAAYLYGSGYTFKYFYLTLYGPAYVFFAGAAAYHWRGLVSRVRLPLLPCLILANALMYIPCFIEWPADHPYMPLYFTGTAIMAWLIAAIEEAPVFWARLERFCADVTYPMFLLHWPVGTLVAFYMFRSYEHTQELFWVTLPLCLLLSSVMVFWVEEPVKVLRRRIRHAACAQPV